MALPWHIPLEASPLKDKTKAPQPTLLKHYCCMDIHEDACEELQVGLMCEIGANNREPVAIQKLIASGMTVARLNLRELEPEACGHLIQAIRQAVYNYSSELEYVYPLALLVDVRGPEIVTGGLKAGPKTALEITKFDQIRLTTDTSWRDSGTVDCLYVGYDNLTDLYPGDMIYIDSLTPGKIQLTVTEVGDDSVLCEVAAGGTIASKMTVRIVRQPKDISDARAKGDSFESLCSFASDVPFEHMEDQITYAINSDIDGVLVPNAQDGHDIRHVKDLLAEKGKHLLVFACIETVLALDNLDAILDESDGLYVDRCVLSMDLPVEKIFIAQKKILAKCNFLGKPCIYKAVINEQIPTLCVTDIANLILDGADVLALELHYDSPLKKYAANFDAIRMAEHCLAAAAVICRQAERIIWQPRIYGNTELMTTPIKEPSKALCISAVELSCRARALVIICLTNSGKTAKLLSHAKPNCPIVAVTRVCHTARQLRFWKGVRSIHYFEPAKETWTAEVEARIHVALDYCKAKRMLKAGDAYVIVTSTRRGGGYCDAVRLLYASARNTLLVD